MIDIHSHIIPNIDDGSGDITTSIEMLKKAQKAGINKIVCSSHHFEGKYLNYSKDYLKSYEATKLIANVSIKNIELLSGNEIMIYPNMVEELNDKKVCTINNTKYVLIEFPMNIKPINVNSVIKELIDNGYIPVIAHPERYKYVQKDINFVKELIESGAVFQMNIASICGYYGSEAEKALIKLLKKKYISLWGSDMHRVDNVYDHFDECLKKLEKVVGKFQSYVIMEKNPKHVIMNEEIEKTA